MTSKEPVDATASPIEEGVKSIKNTASLHDGDAALAFLQSNVAEGEAQAVDEKALVRKIDWMIMPLMFCCYFLQYLDKTLINYAVCFASSTTCKNRLTLHRLLWGFVKIPTSRLLNSPHWRCCSMSPTWPVSSLMGG